MLILLLVANEEPVHQFKHFCLNVRAPGTYLEAAKKYKKTSGFFTGDSSEPGLDVPANARVCACVPAWCVCVCAETGCLAG